ncbi:SMI1/KNR4 family protein [Gordonia sp. ABSL1-1]|uniref:SMI1/KNR4 family protein n=1 Tax=Gordonia sp. ABSL1-1 TaxID=3053923 RepID=UPI002572B5F6|nr:SMI1/KNR4 family protein [Gordonia sp. ABSL1-1]MDL9935367.1 SMI1/KNR4 family protein [Gordonia sp. ABSL1-1]
MTDWQNLIDAQLDIHQKLIDAGYPYDPAAQHAPASEDQIRAAEDRLGTPLTDQHRELLLITNGWTEQHGFNSLLSTEDLGDGITPLGTEQFQFETYPEPGSWAQRLINRNAGWEQSTPSGGGDASLPEGLDDWRWLYPIAEGEDSTGQVLAHAASSRNAVPSQRIYSDCVQPRRGFPDLAGYIAWCIDDDRATLKRLASQGPWW